MIAHKVPVEERGGFTASIGTIEIVGYQYLIVLITVVVAITDASRATVVGEEAEIEQIGGRGTGRSFGVALEIRELHQTMECFAVKQRVVRLVLLTEVLVGAIVAGVESGLWRELRWWEWRRVPSADEVFELGSTASVVRQRAELSAHLRQAESHGVVPVQVAAKIVQASGRKSRPLLRQGITEGPMGDEAVTPA